jgi:hypothetical protein
MGYGGLSNGVFEYPPGSFIWPPMSVSLGAYGGSSDTTPRERIEANRAKKSDCFSKALQAMKNAQQLRNYANTFDPCTEERLKYLAAAQQATEEARRIADEGSCHMELVAHLQKTDWIKTGKLDGVCSEHGLG